MAYENENEELAELRKRRLMELQAQAQQEQLQEEQQKAVEAQRQAILRKILTPEARERLSRLKLAYPDIATNVENQLIVLAQSGRIQSVINDETLKSILAKFTQKKEISITRR